MNIFENAIPNSGEFIKWKEVGDSLQGTYIGRSEGVDSFDHDQFIYMIKDSDGKVWNVAFRKAQAFVNERMDAIHFGQIVGFRFDEERDSKKMPGKKAKIVRIYADNKFVDTDWLARQKALDINADVPAYLQKPIPSQSQPIPTSIKNIFEAPATATAASGKLPTKEATSALIAILQLANTKGVTGEEMSLDEQERTIEEKTGLTLSEDNYTKVILALTSYKA